MTAKDIADQRKNKIIEAAVDAISKYGYHKFSMQHVASLAGVSKGVIHYYFLNKDQLMISVMSKISSNLEEIIRNRIAVEKRPGDQLQLFIKLCLNVVCTTREYYQINITFWNQIYQKEDIRVVVAEHYKRFRTSCYQILEDGINKELFENVDLHSFSSFIIAVIDGVSLQWLFDKDLFNYDKTTHDICSYIMNCINKKTSKDLSK